MCVETLLARLQQDIQGIAASERQQLEVKYQKIQDTQDYLVALVHSLQRDIRFLQATASATAIGECEVEEKNMKEDTHEDMTMCGDIDTDLVAYTDLADQVAKDKQYRLKCQENKDLQKQVTTLHKEFFELSMRHQKAVTTVSTSLPVVVSVPYIVELKDLLEKHLGSDPPFFRQCLWIISDMQKAVTDQYQTPPTNDSERMLIIKYRQYILLLWNFIQSTSQSMQKTWEVYGLPTSPPANFAALYKHEVASHHTFLQQINKEITM